MSVVRKWNLGLDDKGSIHGLGRSSRAGNSNPLQYSFLENSMDRAAWRTIVHGVAKSRGLNLKSVLCKAETLFACLKGKAGGRNCCTVCL